MGLRKIVKKAIKAVTKPVVGIIGGALGKAPDMQAPDAPAPAPAAQVIEPPTKDKADTDDGALTESGKKKAARGGKKSLSVARSSGGGINI
ncbi:Phage protein [Yersinia phage fPS-19]|uniref:Phage protein n=9 Tax=Helsettvirus fPS9 TaxID=2733625 RepID=A0A2C9CZB8_9CAUD|nr:host range and adsorption protein [Yersinia phage fPS-9]SOO46410.1 Phage protein [Yersinia phage fPS-19]SOO46461.1 Phage protein [Yersinia phage fPS-26]SOO46512.1 Phage protein [Yersinia phage fPS-7]SOO46664.1 Phage protein [Yersinia phage fPS-86]SOO46765.1 Phage protein [Yersinia phage fPS-21]SOO46863.1 Phage protein [Yersinia phage fPS-64]SOR54317.1 Phage protein [Yersinia phage fPS-10]SOR54368.1 Phage protein [Yersinia phage fPS16]